mmetsp:Transcript_2115/g.4456  ORF Transcript_2115/g.4456 Transcript_2115/m.4456 type:complete len:279 (-) Transcript_2115:1017-1853(-)
MKMQEGRKGRKERSLPYPLSSHEGTERTLPSLSLQPHTSPSPLFSQTRERKSRRVAPRTSAKVHRSLLSFDFEVLSHAPVVLLFLLFLFLHFLLPEGLEVESSRPFPLSPCLCLLPLVRIPEPVSGSVLLFLCLSAKLFKGIHRFGTVDLLEDGLHADVDRGRSVCALAGESPRSVRDPRGNAEVHSLREIVPMIKPKMVTSRESDNELSRSLRHRVHRDPSSPKNLRTHDQRLVPQIFVASHKVFGHLAPHELLQLLFLVPCNEVPGLGGAPVEEVD